MAFKNNLPQTASESGKAIVQRGVKCTQHFLSEALSPTFFYFLPVAADGCCSKGAPVFKISDFQIPALFVQFSLVSFVGLLFRVSYPASYL